MDLTAFIVIYCAFGAPFGVYYATSGDNRQVSVRIGSLLAFVFWPVFAVKLLLERVSNSPAGKVNPIDAIRVEMEKIAFPRGDIQALFDFRDVFQRFTALAEHVNASANARPARLGALTSSSQTLQSRCLNRRNRNRIARHYMQARAEFIETITGLSIPADSTLIDLAVDLSGLVGDRIPEAEFLALSPTDGRNGRHADESPAATYELAA